MYIYICIYIYVYIYMSFGVSGIWHLRPPELFPGLCRNLAVNTDESVVEVLSFLLPFIPLDFHDVGNDLLLKKLYELYGQRRNASKMDCIG